MTPLLPFLFLAASLGADAQPANPLLDELLTKGVQVAGAAAIKLPPPLLKEGQDLAAHRAVVQKAADKLPLELFLKRSDNSPFALKVDSINNAQGERRGQTIDLYYVAFGKLDAVAPKDVIHQLLVGTGKGGDGEGSTFLTADQLRQRGIEPAKTAGLEERFATLEFVLLDKVKVSGVTRNVKTVAPRSVVLAMKLDERFADDKQYPNRWRSVSRATDKADQVGPPQPYSGLAGYVSITELLEPGGALFVEMHVAFAEPPEWFGGPNLLRSKLPILIQENVRNFRRRLARD